jgi:prepilin-type N-terminal cleavage/methylation domain-containing protein
MIRRLRMSRRAVAAEQGFTLIEVMMAAVMLVVIVSATTVLFIHGNDSSLASERNSQLISVADQQIETIRQEVKTMGFNALAMTSAPVTTGSNTTLAFNSNTYTNPNHFVSSGTGCGAMNQGYAIEANYNDVTAGAAPGVIPWTGCTNTSTAPAMVAEPLEILTGGFVTPLQSNITVGSDTATVYTYVTDTYVGCTTAAGSTAGTCPTTSGNVVSGCTWPATTSTSTTCADARRVIVAVVLNNHGSYVIGQSSPVYVSTIFTSPTPANAPNASIGLTLGLQLG